MKCIGYEYEDKKWKAEIPPHMANARTLLYVSENNVNVSLADYQMIGWILPGDQIYKKGKIYETKQDAGTNGVPVYIKYGDQKPEKTLDFGSLQDRIGNLEKAYVRTHAAVDDLVVNMLNEINRLKQQIKDLESFVRSSQTVADKTTAADTDKLRDRAACYIMGNLLPTSKMSVDDMAEYAYSAANALIEARQ